MTILFTQDNENGTHGNVLTTGLTGYDAMTGQDPVYDNTWASDGSLSAKYALAGNFSLQTKTIASATNTYWRRYLKIGIPSSSTAVVGVYDTNAVILGSVRILTTGKIQLRNAGFVSLDESTHTFVAGEEVRVEYHPIVGGTSTVRLFWGANLNGATPDETLSGTNGTAGTGLITQVREGVVSSTTVTMYADSSEIDNADWPGPVAGGGPVILPASGTVAVYGPTSGNATTVPAVEVETPSLTMMMFVGTQLDTNGASLLTSAGRWSWLGAPYAGPGASIAPSGAAMELTWDDTPASAGNGVQAAVFTMDTLPLVAGHRIKAKVVVNVPVGSPDVALINAFTQEEELVSVKGRDIELTMFFTWDVGRNPQIGVRAEPTGPGSVLIKRVILVDTSSPAGEWTPAGGTVLPPPPPLDTEAPTTPGTPVANITNSNVALTWTASTDNVGVVSYEVHRSASSGFTPVDGTKRTNAPSAQWTDNGIPDGTYYYKIIAVDAAGNKSTESAQVQAIVTSAAPTEIMAGISTQLQFGNRTDWQGYRAYTASRLSSCANSTGALAGQNRPEYIAYSKQGAPLSGSYATIRATCLTDLNNFYYTSQTGQTHSSRWGIKLYWSNGNENSDKGMLGPTGRTSPVSSANLALYVESQRALYDAVHYIDPTTGQRRFPDAYAGSNPTQYQESEGIVEQWLHAAARYHDFVMWSMYPPGRGNSSNQDKYTDPEYNWPSFDPGDWNDGPLGFMLRCWRRTNLARAQARIDTGDPNFDLTINCGEIGIASDPDDNTTRPYYVVYGWFGAAVQYSQDYNMTCDFITYWDNQLADPNPHTKILDEPPTSDHGGTGTTSPTTADAFRNWASYHTGQGGSLPGNGAWDANPKAGWRHTGTQV